MKFTLSWLKEHLDTKATLAEVRDTLTMLGLEVEGITNPAEALKGFVVGYVVEAIQHPNADRLRVCKVDTGTGTIVQVVCGAPNVREGIRIAFAKEGVLHGHQISLKRMHPRFSCLQKLPSSAKAVTKRFVRSMRLQGLQQHTPAACGAAQLTKRYRPPPRPT